VVPPPRRRNPLGRLLLGMIVVTLVALVGMVAVNAVTETPDLAYQNDDYRVPPPDRSPPPLPVPETVGEAQALIAENPFYDQSAPIPVRCSAQPISVGRADDGELESHFEALMECLVRVFQPPVESARFEIVRPTVTVYGSEITTRCGRSEVNAFYCGADQQVYYSSRLPESIRIVQTDKWAADVVMAHEFGHALQARTGILISSKALGQESGDKQTDLDLSRRLETQADCLSGMFVRAVGDSLNIQPADLQGIRETYNAVGDDVVSGNPSIIGNHGLGQNRRYWGSTGLGTSEVGACNTFTAEARLVR
jgi:predicted metalloprotease